MLCVSVKTFINDMSNILFFNLTGYETYPKIIFNSFYKWRRFKQCRYDILRNNYIKNFLIYLLYQKIAKQSVIELARCLSINILS